MILKVLVYDPLATLLEVCREGEEHHVGMGMAKG